MTCNICGKEVNMIHSFYAKELKGIFLPRLDVCEDCLKNRKEEVEKRKKRCLKINMTRKEKDLKALDKLDNTLCLNANRQNLEFNIDKDEHIDCKDLDEMIDCIETIKKDLMKKPKSKKRDILFKDIRDLLDWYVWETGYSIGDKNGHRICEVFGCYTTFRNKKVCDFLDNNFENKVLMNAQVLTLGNDYCILDVELPYMEGEYEDFRY